MYRQFYKGMGKRRRRVGKVRNFWFNVRHWAGIPKTKRKV